MLTLIKNGDILAPVPRGVQSVLVAGGKIAQIGEVDETALSRLGCEYDIIDAAECWLTPGLIDPHEHICGAGGEQGFGSRQPEVPLEALLKTGITTVVGCLGTDTTTRTLPGLLAKARQLEAGGITTYIYTGGFPVPTPTITGRVLDDIVMIDKVIGVGEIAISDVRSLDPQPPELARLVSEAMVGGTLSGKAGVTHFHVGPAKGRLALLRAMLENHDIEARYLYPTHINRSRELFMEAVALARLGAFVDIDTVEENLVEWLRLYREQDAPPSQLTVSSDAHTLDGSPQKLYNQLVATAHEFGLREVLPYFTFNPAQALGLAAKGRLEIGADADILVLDKATFAIRQLFARGRRL
jgi:beta-aspartyl-dipeptidase (metallo-type)